MADCKIGTFAVLECIYDDEGAERGISLVKVGPRHGLFHYRYLGHQSGRSSRGGLYGGGVAHYVTQPK